MKEREFQSKIRDIFEDLRGYTEKFILNIYWSLDEKQNVILDEDSLKEEFEEKLKEIKELLEEVEK